MKKRPLLGKRSVRGGFLRKHVGFVDDLRAIAFVEPDGGFFAYNHLLDGLEYQRKRFYMDEVPNGEK